MSSYWDAVYGVIGSKPFLRPIENDLYGIAEKVREYDPSFFVVFNVRRKKHEIHSTVPAITSYQMDCPGNGYDLDDRTLHAIREGDLRNRGREIFAEIDRHNERLEKAQEKRVNSRMKDAIKESRWHFKKFAEANY